MLVSNASARASRFAVAVSLLVAFGATPGMAAGRYLNTIDDSLGVRASGRSIVATGPIGCPAGLLVDIHVKVSQESGATGTGHISKRCTGAQDHWLAIVDAWGPAFETGPAEAKAWATTWDGEAIARSWDWAKAVTLGPASE